MTDDLSEVLNENHDDLRLYEIEQLSDGSWIIIFHDLLPDIEKEYDVTLIRD